MRGDIRGTSAAEIADSVRDLLERGELRPGEMLPPVRALAAQIGVNRNTVVAAYRHLAQAGLVVSHGRAGTKVAGTAPLAQEGSAPDTVLIDLASGNPDPSLIPDPSEALSRVAGRAVLYGEPVIDRGLHEWAREWMSEAVDPALAFRLTVTGGASDAIDRLLSDALTRDDPVGLEDPCFLPSLNTVRLGGYRAVAIPVDSEGMTVPGVRAALAAGVRAIVTTPRAQNPTGASLSPRRAQELRAVLSDHPFVLVIEDDHFSLLARTPFHSIVGPGHRRFALIRSVSKFLGPDMCLAVVASDPETAERLALRLSPGTSWVSHLLQRLAHSLLADADVRAQIAAARTHYGAANEVVAAKLAAKGVFVAAGDGLNLWVPLPVPARAVSAHLMSRGWRVRSGEDFVLADAAASRHLRLTVHDLGDRASDRLVADLVAAVGEATGARMG